MAVNNEVYDELADGWWDETGFLHGIKTLLNPPRMAYLRRVLLTHGRHPGGLSQRNFGNSRDHGVHGAICVAHAHDGADY